MSKKMRLFWAVNLPGEMKDRLAALKRDLLVPGVDAVWVKTENLHLTVVFIGETDINIIKKMVAGVENALRGFPPLRLSLGGLGFFPGAGRPRVLWAGVRGDLDGFGELHRRVENALIPLGFNPETKPFSPHLTLARIKSPRGCDALVRRVTSQAKVEIPGELRIDSVELMRSELSAQGPAYTVLARVGFNTGL